MLWGVRTLLRLYPSPDRHCSWAFYAARYPIIDVESYTVGHALATRLRVDSERHSMYHSDTIVAVIKRLNDTYFLPAIQREFVWKPTQVIRLFDSIMQHYPIGSFLFWELEQENRDKWDAYYFLDE